MTDLGPKNPGDIGQACPTCAAAAKADRALRGYATATCGACGHRFVTSRPVPEHAGEHVAEVYGDDYFHGGGAGYTDYAAEAELLRRHGAACAKQLGQHSQPGRLLDVGAAAGFLMEGYADHGWSCVGVEPNAAMGAAARARGLDVRTSTFESFCDEPSAAAFDVVAFVQVLPHFVEPAEALRIARVCTRPGGLWLVETWNRRSFVARCRGERWHEYSPPSVLHWFTPESLDALVAQFGGARIERGRPHPRSTHPALTRRRRVLHDLSPAVKRRTHG